ncbi:metal ABC transporter ATP-binding protein [Calditrichota bacterium]
MNTKSSVVEFQDVNFAYNGNTILEDVNFEIRSGELSYIVGANGSGKTTLLKLILGLLRPKQGVVKVLGESPINARPSIGYAPQHALFDPNFPITAQEIVMMGRLKPKFFTRRASADNDAMQRCLLSLGIQDLADRQFSDLSGGQRQRVLIARALVSDPKILLLDEPTANVDMESESRLLERIVADRGDMTVLLVSHDLTVASGAVANVLCVNRNVVMHPTTEVTVEAISEIYDQNVRLIQHGVHLHKH